MKSVLISIKPKWCEKIALTEKTIDIRKTQPKLNTPFKCYIYCTTVKALNLQDYCKLHAKTGGLIDDWNGKVIGEFVCDGILRHCEMANADIAEQEALVKREKIFKYSNGREVFGWHISNLVIYDKPRKISEFWKAGKCEYATEDGCNYKYHCTRAGRLERCGEQLTRPPQSWCYVEGIGNER